MDKGAGLSVGGISKIASSNKKITLRNWYSGVRFFHCLWLFMWSKGFPAENARLQGKPFLVYSLPLPAGIGNLFLQTVLGELFALFPLQKFPTKMTVSYHYPLSKHSAAISNQRKAPFYLHNFIRTKGSPDQKLC